MNFNGTEGVDWYLRKKVSGDLEPVRCPGEDSPHLIVESRRYPVQRSIQLTVPDHTPVNNENTYALFTRNKF